MHNCYVQLFHIFKKKKYFLRKGLKTVALILSVSVLAFVYLCICVFVLADVDFSKGGSRLAAVVVSRPAE